MVIGRALKLYKNYELEYSWRFSGIIGVHVITWLLAFTFIKNLPVVTKELANVYLDQLKFAPFLCKWVTKLN